MNEACSERPMNAWSVDDTVANLLRSAGVKKSSKITRMSLSGRAMYLWDHGEDEAVPMAMKTVDTWEGTHTACMHG